MGIGRIRTSLLDGDWKGRCCWTEIGRDGSGWGLDVDAKWGLEGTSIGRDVVCGWGLEGIDSDGDWTLILDGNWKDPDAVAGWELEGILIGRDVFEDGDWKER